MDVLYKYELHKMSKGVSEVKPTMLKLRKLRLEKGVSQTYISRKLGFKYPSGYSNIEQGRNKLSYDHAVIIADILNVDVSELSDTSKKFDQNLHNMCKVDKEAS